MSEYQRLTKREGKEVKALAWDGEVLHRLADLEDKIENGRLLEIPDVTYKFAIVKYPFRKNKPLKISEYYPYSYDILNKLIVNCYRNCDSMNFYVVEEGFTTKEAAEARLKELQEKE